MIKIRLLLIFLQLSVAIYGQTTVVKFIGFDYCTDKHVKLVPEYFISHLTDNEKWELISMSDSLNQFLLEKNNFYVISGVVYRRGTIEIECLSSFYTGKSDTLYFEIELFRIQRNCDGRNSLWYDCEMLCNGLSKDFHRNGTLHLKGYFKNGKKKHKIIVYDRNGGKNHSRDDLLIPMPISP